MHRLTDFQHHIVTDVHQCGNAADTAALQTLFHPIRSSRFRINIFNNAADKTAAVGRCINTDSLFFLTADRGRLNFNRRKRTLSQRRNLTRNALNTQTISAVRRNFQHKQRIVQIQVFTDISTDRRIFRQNVQTIYTIIRQTQFIGRT